METQAYLISAAVVIISAILIYFIAAMTMREKSYDEILAEQRKRREELFSSTGGSSDKSKAKKKLKKKPRPERTDTADGGGTNSDQEQPVKMVELELEPEIIDNVSKSPKEPKEPKTGKGKKKPILVNKQEKPEVHTGSSTPETIHYRPPPKDSVALKHEREHKGTEQQPEVHTEKPVTTPPPEQPEKQKKTKKEKKEVVETIPEPVAEVTTTAAPPKRSKKAKDNAPSAAGDSVKTDSSQVINLIQTTYLSNADIQTLIEILLSKQAGSDLPSDKWKTKSQKGDPVANLEKQLAEKSHALKEEQEQSQATARRLKEVQQELTRERQQYAASEKELKEKLAAQTQDIQALQLRMQQTHEQHRNEVAQLKMKLDQRQGQIHDGQAVMLQRLKEENVQLQEKVSNTQKQLKIVQDELNKQIQERTSFEGGRKLLESQLLQCEDKIHKLEATQRDMEAMWTKKYKELNDRFQREQAKSSSLSRDLDKANKEKHHLEQELAKLQSNVKDLENAKNQKDEELNQLQSQLQILRSENNRLTSELKTYKERTAGEGEEAPAKPQQEAVKVMEEPRLERNAIQHTECDNKMKVKDEEITKLKSTLEARVADCSRLELELEAQRNKNNALRQKNWKAMDALSQMEKMAENTSTLKSQLECKDIEINKLKKELSHLQNPNTALEEEKSTVSANIKAANQEAAMSQEQLEQLKKQLNQKEEELKKIAAKLESVQKENETLMKQVHSLESASQSANATSEQIEKLQQELHSLRVTVDQQTQQITAQQEKIREFEQVLEEQKVEITKKEREIELLKEQLQQKNEQLKSVEQKQNEGQNLSMQAADLQQRELSLTQLQQQLEEREKQLEEQKLELQQQTQKLEAKLSEVSNREASVEELSKKLEQQEVVLQQEKQMLNEKELQLSKQTEQLEKQAAQKDQSQLDQCVALQSEVDCLRKENDKLLAEKCAHEDASRSKEAEIGHLMQDLTKAQTAIEELERGLEEKNNTIENLRAQIEELRRHTNEVCALKSEMTHAEAELDIKMNKLASEIENQVSRSKSEDVVNMQREVEEIRRSRVNIWQRIELFNKLKFRLNSLTIAEKLQGEIDDLRNLLQHSAEENEKLKNELKCKNEELSSIAKKVANPQTASDHGVSVDEQNKVAELEQQLKSRDRYIIKLQKKLDETITENDELLARIGQGTGSEEQDNRTALIESLMQEKKDLENQLHAVSRSSGGDQQLMDELHNKNAEISSLKHELNNVKCLLTELQHYKDSHVANLREIEQLTKELMLLKEEMKKKDEMQLALSKQDVTIAELTKSMEHYKQECHELRQGCEQATVALTKAEKSAEEVSQIQAQLAAKVTEVHTLKALLHKHDKEMLESQDVNDNIQYEFTTPSGNPVSDNAQRESIQNDAVFTQDQPQWDMSDLVLDLETKEAELIILQEVLSQKEHALQELKQKYSKAMDTLSKAENTTQSDAAEELARIKETLQKIFPDLHITESTTHTWIVNLEQCINKIQVNSNQVTPSVSEIATLRDELSQIKNVNSHLENQVQHYKSVLADTEQILNKLQSSVESEEQKWMHKLHKTEEDLEKARKENSRLLEDIKRLQNNSQNLENNENLPPRLSPVGQDDTQMMSSEMSQEATSIRLELEEALRKLKEMKAANIKLTGLLKIGQEALKMEQDEVKRLKALLAEQRKSMSNGSEVYEELDELKQKLSETQKLLEKEKQVTQQLTQKLGASVEDNSSEV